ncbi:MAG TPA: DUF6427 family protein [Lutibacter sp.]
MIANFFNKTKPAIVFSVVVLLFGYYFTSAFLLYFRQMSISFLIKKIGFFLLLVLLLLIVNFIVKKNKLTRDNSYSLLLMVFFLGTFPEAMFSSNIIFTNFALMLGFRKIYSLRSGVDTDLKLFDASFWIGIATLFYSWSIFYILLLYISIIIYKKLTAKNLFIPAVGFVAPMLIYFTYCLYFESIPFFYSKFSYEINLDFSAYTAIKLLIPLLFIAIVLVWSLFKVTPKVVSVRNNFKLSWEVLINHLLISAVIVVLIPTKTGSELFFLIFPGAVIVANLMYLIKSKIFKNAILYSFLLISVIVYFL